MNKTQTVAILYAESKYADGILRLCARADFLAGHAFAMESILPLLEAILKADTQWDKMSYYEPIDRIREFVNENKK
jgi:hypothetical protein